MELKNPLYKNIGVHVITSIFTVEKGVTKVLLVKRINNPFNGYWLDIGNPLDYEKADLDFEEIKELLLPDEKKIIPDNSGHE